MIAPPLAIRSDIRDALDRGRPVVALESTVIAHGLPAPSNVETALAMEAAIREAGAEPATIAVMDGRIRIGLDAREIRALADAPADTVRKASRRDLASVVASGTMAATTVSATMIAAHLAGIGIFATGGIGGVHRGQPFDISADLTELGRTPVAVVCSGPKAILDLAATREVLETQGVPIIGYGTDAMPEFYSRGHEFEVDARADSPEEAAGIIRAHLSLGLGSGMIFAVPVPEEDALDPAMVAGAIEAATAEAHAAGLSGGKVTPFVLARVAELTGGASLAANRALLINNARTAADIAVALQA